MAKKKNTKKAVKKSPAVRKAASKPAVRTMAKKKSSSKLPKQSAARSTSMLARRADLGAGVDTYFAKQSGPHKKIAERLHALVTTHAPDATHAVKWGMPVYEQQGMLCYIRVRPKYVTLGFYESGVSLDDPNGLLDGTGDNMRHAKLALDAPIPEDDLVRFIQQAVAFNADA